MLIKQIKKRLFLFSLLFFLGSINNLNGQTIFSASFETGTDGFAYSDNTIFETNQGNYASGSAINSFDGGALSVTLGGIDGADILNMSGGWQRSFNLLNNETVRLTFDYQLSQSGNYEGDEISQLLASIDGNLLAPGGFIRQTNGEGNAGNIQTSGLRTFTTSLDLSAGNHSLIIGGFNNKKTLTNESTEIIFDNIVLEIDNCGSSGNILVDDPQAAQQLVDNLTVAQYKQNIQTIAGFEDRSQFGAGSQSYNNATNWLTRIRKLGLHR